MPKPPSNTIIMTSGADTTIQLAILSIWNKLVRQLIATLRRMEAFSSDWNTPEAWSPIILQFSELKRISRTGQRYMRTSLTLKSDTEITALWDSACSRISPDTNKPLLEAVKNAASNLFESIHLPRTSKLGDSRKVKLSTEDRSVICKALRLLLSREIRCLRTDIVDIGDILPNSIEYASRTYWLCAFTGYIKALNDQLDKVAHIREIFAQLGTSPPDMVSSPADTQRWKDITAVLTRSNHSNVIYDMLQKKYLDLT